MTYCGPCESGRRLRFFPMIIESRFRINRKVLALFSEQDFGPGHGSRSRFINFLATRAFSLPSSLLKSAFLSSVSLTVHVVTAQALLSEKVVPGVDCRLILPRLYQFINRNVFSKVLERFPHLGWNDHPFSIFNVFYGLSYDLATPPYRLCLHFSSFMQEKGGKRKALCQVIPGRFQPSFSCDKPLIETIL